MTNQCRHGRLARKCEICELETQKAELMDAMRLALPHIKPTAIDPRRADGPIEDAYINTICRRALERAE